MKNFEFLSETLVQDIKKTCNFLSKVQVQYLEDPLASMCYFKQVYERGKLDTKYANPPLSWSTEMQQPKFEDSETFNLLDRFYHTPVETSRGKFILLLHLILMWSCWHWINIC